MDWQEYLLNFGKQFIDRFLNLVDFSNINNVVSQARNFDLSLLWDFISNVGYFFDSNIMIFIFNLEIAWISFRLIWAVILRVKSFIPGISSI